MFCLFFSLATPVPTCGALTPTVPTCARRKRDPRWTGQCADPRSGAWRDTANQKKTPEPDHQPNLGSGGILETEVIPSWTVCPCQKAYKVNWLLIKHLSLAGWGHWSSWGDCSRSCGSGARFRTRRCDSPRPAYGGDHCVGDREEFKLCNVMDCPNPEVQCFFWN